MDDGNLYQANYWKALWDAFHTSLLDPADIHSTIEDLMARTTNKLAATEISFVQRKIRYVLRNTSKTNPEKNKMMMGRILPSSSTTNTIQQQQEMEGKTIAERFHLLNQAIIKRILPPCRPIGTVDPIECAYWLMLFCHESLWDRTAAIALQSIQSAGIEMDVNKQKPITTIPSTYHEMELEPPELPPGVTVPSLAFLMALALRKYR